MITGIILAEPTVLALGLVGLVVVAIIIAAFVIGVYNKLVTMRNRYKNAYAQIDVQLKRRYDLIPNLVETAKGYMAHERGTLEAVTAARNIAYAASKIAAANPGDSGAIKNLASRSEEHTSELQSHSDLVCRLLLEKKKKIEPHRQHNHNTHS